MFLMFVWVFFENMYLKLLRLLGLVVNKLTSIFSAKK